MIVAGSGPALLSSTFTVAVADVLSSNLADGDTVYYQLEVDGSPVGASAIAATPNLATNADNDLTVTVETIGLAMSTAQLGAHQVVAKWYSPIDTSSFELLAVSSSLDIQASDAAW